MRSEIKEAFKFINLSIIDFAKILNSIDRTGSGANFLAAMCGLAITEPIAKLYAPFIYERGGRKRIIRSRTYRADKADKFKSIDTKLAVKSFYGHCFKDGRYKKLSFFIWDCFRNGHVHLFQPKKVIEFPDTRIDKSFLAGVSWPRGKTLDDLLKDPSLVSKGRLEHLRFQFCGRSKKGSIPRFAFIFSPHIYYFDLIEAIKEFKRQLKTNISLQKRFAKGYKLMVAEKRLDFTNRDKIPEDCSSFLVDELKSSIKRYA